VREIQEGVFSSQKKLTTPETGAKTPAAGFLAGKKADNFEKRCEKFRKGVFSSAAPWQANLPLRDSQRQARCRRR
jgi:hypothetical protein